uniref:small integral membrane protein 14 isoform X1 n=1 Tax=Podarcis muralis TaxID=64176 RepID=UPI00109F514B|nr:small integral membrane protein 14 isoform X1 [Podarcis muralis]
MAGGWWTRLPPPQGSLRTLQVNGGCACNRSLSFPPHDSALVAFLLGGRRGVRPVRPRSPRETRGGCRRSPPLACEPADPGLAALPARLTWSTESKHQAKGRVAPQLRWLASWGCASCSPDPSKPAQNLRLRIGGYSRFWRGAEVGSVEKRKVFVIKDRF